MAPDTVCPMNETQRRQAVLGWMTLPATPKNGRGRLVGTAMELFYFNGINVIGLDRIVTEAGVSKTTFYKHFESKDQLVVAAIQGRDAWQMSAWRGAVEVMAGSAPRDQLESIFDILDVTFSEPTFHGCQFINAAAEYPNPNDPIHQAAVHHKLATRDWVRDLANRAGALDADTFTDAFMMLFEGALVLRQSHNREDAARAAKPHVQRLIEQFVPKGDPSHRKRQTGGPSR